MVMPYTIQWPDRRFLRLFRRIRSRCLLQELSIRSVYFIYIRPNNGFYHILCMYDFCTDLGRHSHRSFTQHLSFRTADPSELLWIHSAFCVIQSWHPLSFFLEVLWGQVLWGQVFWVFLHIHSHHAWNLFFSLLVSGLFSILLCQMHSRGSKLEQHIKGEVSHMLSSI